MKPNPEYVATVTVFEKFVGWIVRLTIEQPHEDPEVTERWFPHKFGANRCAKRTRGRFRRVGWTVK